MSRDGLNIYNIKRVNLNDKYIKKENKNLVYKEINRLMFNISHYLLIVHIPKKSHISISFGKLDNPKWTGCFCENNNMIKLKETYRDTCLLFSLESIFYHEYGHFIYHNFYQNDFFTKYNIKEEIETLLKNLSYSETIINIRKGIEQRMNIFKTDYWSTINPNEEYLLRENEIFARFFSSFMLYKTVGNHFLDFTVEEISQNEYILSQIFNKINNSLCEQLENGLAV